MKKYEYRAFRILNFDTEELQTLNWYTKNGWRVHLQLSPTLLLLEKETD